MMPPAIRACLRVQGTMSRVRAGVVPWNEHERSEFLNNRSAQSPTTVLVDLPDDYGLAHWKVSARFLMLLAPGSSFVDLNEELMMYIIEPDLGGD